MLDIEALRKRIGRSGGRRRRRESPRRPARRRPAAVPVDLLEPTSRFGGSGSFLLQEQLFGNGSPHGKVSIAQLQDMPTAAVEIASNRTVSPSDPRRWVFLDTETTGLSGGTGTCPFLIGTGAIEDGGFRTRLFFMRDFDEEPAMLRALAEHLSAYDTVVSFNGKTFDLPLLEARFRLKRQPNPFEEMDHFDVLHPARRLWKKRLRSCRLTALEASILGFTRRGDIPGSLIPDRFFEYLRSRDPSGLAPVFHHNRLDIVSLACISSILLNCLSKPRRAPLRHGEDLFSLARWVGTLRQDDLAADLYGKAIRAGLPRRTLGDALWESAKHARRLGRHRAKVRMLGEMAQLSATRRPAAWVELAKHYEHLEKDFRKALDLTRRAMRVEPSDELQHRQRRLLRKLETAEGTRPAAVSSGDAGSSTSPGDQP